MGEHGLGRAARGALDAKDAWVSRNRHGPHSTACAAERCVKVNSLDWPGILGHDSAKQHSDRGRRAASWHPGRSRSVPPPVTQTNQGPLVPTSRFARFDVELEALWTRLPGEDGSFDVDSYDRRAAQTGDRVELTRHEGDV